MTLPCGECRLGVKAGSVCSFCSGTGFISNEITMDETNVPPQTEEAVVAPEVTAETVTEAPKAEVVQ